MAKESVSHSLHRFPPLYRTNLQTILLFVLEEEKRHPYLCIESAKSRVLINTKKPFNSHSLHHTMKNESDTMKMETAHQMKSVSVYKQTCDKHCKLLSALQRFLLILFFCFVLFCFSFATNLVYNKLIETALLSTFVWWKSIFPSVYII